MARRPPPANTMNRPAMLTAPQMRAGIALLKRRRDEVAAFDPRTVIDQHSAPALDALSRSVEESLVRIFGHDTLDYDRYREAARFDRGPFNYAYVVPPQEFQASIAKSKETSLAILGGAMVSLEEQLEVIGEEVAIVVAPEEEGNALSDTKVFLVHGHDNAAKLAVARFLEKLGLEPIILHERPNKGRPLITKLREEAAQIRFAVVLMSPDDEGGKAGEAQKARARQNVVFELGFFIGELGPERVAAIVTGEIETPSDYDGVVYISMNGRWEIDLAKELREAGYAIDFNNVI